MRGDDASSAHRAGVFAKYLNTKGITGGVQIFTDLCYCWTLTKYSPQASAVPPPAIAMSPIAFGHLDTVPSSTHAAAVVRRNHRAGVPGGGAVPPRAGATRVG